MLTFVFPGQGSQKRGMGDTLFDSVREYAALEKEVDALVGYSIRNLCLTDPENRLTDTRYTQPALYIVNALHYYREMGEGARPDFLAGHSLGEYNALLAAGVFDLLTGLRLVIKRGELMSAARQGGMAAVIGLQASQVEDIVRVNNLSTVDIANFNSPVQVVISGPREDIQRGIPLFEEAGAQLVISLPVSGAFHSRYMREAGQAFTDLLATTEFSPPRIPVIANVTAQPYPTENAAEAVRDLLTRQITQSVQWTQSVNYLISQGVKTFKEIGPGTVLTRLIQQIRRVPK